MCWEEEHAPTELGGECGVGHWRKDDKEAGGSFRAQSPWMEGRSRRFSAEDDLSQPTQNSEKDRHVDCNPSSVTSLAGRSFA